MDLHRVGTPGMIWESFHIQDVCNHFLRLFHWEIPRRELLHQFYAIAQELLEMVPQFTIHFQDLYRQLTQDVSVDNLKDTFLTTLHEPLRKTLALVGLSQQAMKQVVDYVLTMDKPQNNNSFSMSSL
mgnify:FL=1